MYKVAGYRKMVNYTQKEMADKLGISEVTYRKKEKGVTSFKDYEMILFHNVVSDLYPEVSINDIFFNHQLQKLQ